MLARVIREEFEHAMGDALDLIRVSDIGERQLKQLQITLRNQHNAHLIRLFSELQEKGVIQQCDCLKHILVAKKSAGVETSEMKKLYDAKSRCPDCGGSGYKDRFTIPHSEDEEE